VVIVYLHWGIEYQTCPSTYQTRLAGRLAGAGASAVIGTHAHVLQGAGWKHNGTYVAYGLGNYLWWMSFHNIQDDNGLLTLTFQRARVTGAHFAPSHLDHRGVPVPATGAQKRRILAQWRRDRGCTGLAAHPPR
jgi:poly-gamma-glutamate synthesis protein (capsule biosynthesis protein)